MRDDYGFLFGKTLMKDRVQILLELTKFRITSFVTITTFLGYILAAGRAEWKMAYPLLGILLLACGSAVLNHWQERDTDMLMARTKKRPIPSGRISARNALALAASLALTGAAILYAFSGWMAAGLGVLALIWYNGIYTPMKKKNPFAVVPGSLIGAIPPVVGWVAAGGDPLDPKILMVAFFFFIWQIPHFWLLLLFYDDDYRTAGFPTLGTLFGREQIIRITFIWMAAIAVACIGMPLFHIVTSPSMSLLLFLTAAYLVYQAVGLFSVTTEKKGFIHAFKSINIFALSVIVIISLDRLLLSF
jgi:heme o synthase